MITANVGNSRAILVDKYRKFRELTTDHIPTDDNPSEKSRVNATGGPIANLHVSRMIGYTEARKYGVIHEPEIKYFNLEEDDQILILASDGIWEHMTIQNVA